MITEAFRHFMELMPYKKRFHVSVDILSGNSSNLKKIKEVLNPL